jgi:vesicle coat complex subunit
LLISQCGPAALGPVVRASRDRDPHVRESAAYVVGSVSRDAALPVLTRLLDDPEQSVRCAAVKSLPGLKPEPGVAVPLFVKCLGDADSSVRWHAADALRGIGPPAKDAVPSLKKLLQDESGQVRYVAAEALREIRRKVGEDSPQW